jgi:sigma-B regulation protein RsbU (phosphoserine phosphatase)
MVDQDHLGLVIGDVSGKGVPAAIFMAMSRTLLKATALRGQPPGECLTDVNASLCRDNTTELFVTLFYGVLNVRTGELRYSSGGHNPPYVASASGKVTALPGTGDTLVGVLEGLKYKTNTAQLPPGDALVLYTDGITEAMNAKRELFDEERLEAVLKETSGRSAKEIVDQSVAAVRAHAGVAPQSDDITCLAVRWLVPAKS